MLKRLEYGPLVQIALRGLDPEGARRVESWFKYLECWDTDPRVRENSVPLAGHEGVFMLITTTELRIFFRVDGDTVTVLDVANRSTILTTLGLSNGGLGDVTHDSTHQLI